MHLSSTPSVRTSATELSADPAGIPSYEDRPAPLGGSSRRRSSWMAGPRPLGVGANVARVARPVFTAATMVAVVAMAVVTSVPANAVLRDGEPVALTSAAAPAQHLAVSMTDIASIARDNYTITAAPAAPAPAAAPASADSGAAPASAPSGSYVRYPFDGELRLSDGFGPRVSPCAGCSTFHQGTDFLPGEGNPVLAMADGVVQDIEDSGGLGVHVVINHWIDGQFLTTTSAHMQEGSVMVSVGQTVHAGDQIGRVGNTGDSTGPHLHFELRLAGTDAVDANAWIAEHAG